MPRTLPWLTKGAAKADVKTSSPAPKRRKRDSSPEDLVDANLDDIATPPPRPKQKKRADRTPSTSPAPAPPDVDYMLPGYHADDIYMMVEDVFLTTAKAYTQHIHYAEYVRLKKLAKSRGEKTLSALDHGTDGRTGQSRGMKIRQEREAQDRKMEDALGAGSESEEEEDPYMQDPQLAGLMTKDTDKGIARELAGMAKAKSKTRAAAGFMESPHTASRFRDALEEDSDEGKKAQKTAKASSSKVPKVFEEVSDDEGDEDDLDAAPPPRPKVKPEVRVNGHHDDRSNRRNSSDDKRDNIFKRFAGPSQDKDRSSAPKEVPSKEPPPPPIKVEDAEDTYEAPRPKPVRPTYKKAQNRQASQALNSQDAVPKRSPLRPTSSENGIFKRPSLPPLNRDMPETSTTTLSSTKTATTLPTSQTSPDKSEVKAAAADYLARRAERVRKEKEQQGRTKRVDDIPTFLF